MAGLIRDEDFRVDVGRATEGRMFLRVVHEPTQVSRVVIGLNGRPHAVVVQELLSTVLQEIEVAGWRKPSEKRGERRTIHYRGRGKYQASVFVMTDD